MMRDNAIFRHTIPDRGHPERMRSHPGGGQLPKALISPPWEQRMPRLAPGVARRADPGCALVPPPCLVFPFRGGSLGPLLFPVSSVSGLTFRGFGGLPCGLVGVCT